MNLETLVDDIYEAGVVPDGWRRVLDQMAEIADAEGALLFAAAPGVPAWLASDKIHDRIDTWARSPYGRKNPRGDRLVPMTEPRFLTDLDAFTREELENDDYYTQMLRPMGFGWCVGTSIRAPSGDTLVFSVEKAWDKGPVPRAVAETLDQLRPHLARAGLLAGRIGLERIRTVVATLEMVGLPAVAVTQAGRVVAANAGFLASDAGVTIGARDQVQFSAASAQTMFIDALDARAPSIARTGKSIAVAGSASAAPLIAHVLPLRRSGLDLFAGAVAILYLTPLTLQVSPAPELLKALFDLTPAEARVASLLVEGGSVDSIATVQDVSVNTVRSHLKSVFSKIGVERQSELISLLGQRVREKTTS